MKADAHGPRMSEPKEFFDAIRKGDAAKVKELLGKDRALVNAKSDKGFSPVTVAGYYGQYAVLDAILAHKPGMTVHDAALAGDLKRVKELVGEHAELVNDTSSPDGFPPLALAAYAGRGDVVRYLLSKGADLNYAAPGLGFNALTGAVSENRAEVVKILVKAGANVNYPYEGGEAAVLVTAAANGNPDIVQTLLDAGADPNVRTTDGTTPLSMAIQKGHLDVAGMLRRRGGKV